MCVWHNENIEKQKFCHGKSSMIYLNNQFPIRYDLLSTYCDFYIFPLFNSLLNTAHEVEYVSSIYTTRDTANPWWRHQTQTFSASLSLCEGNPPVTGRFPSQRPVTGNFDVFFYLRLNKRLSKQPRRRWFETPLGSLWRYCNAIIFTVSIPSNSLTVLCAFCHDDNSEQWGNIIHQQEKTIPKSSLYLSLAHRTY